MSFHTATLRHSLCRPSLFIGNESRTNLLQPPFYLISHSDLAGIFPSGSIRLIQTLRAKGALATPFETLRDAMAAHGGFCRTHHPHTEHQADLAFCGSIVEFLHRMPILRSYMDSATPMEEDVTTERELNLITYRVARTNDSLHHLCRPSLFFLTGALEAAVSSPFSFVTYGDVASIYSASSMRTVANLAAKGLEVETFGTLREALVKHRQFCVDHHPHEDHTFDHDLTCSVAEIARDLPYIVPSDSEDDLEHTMEDDNSVSSGGEQFWTPPSSGFEAGNHEQSNTVPNDNGNKIVENGVSDNERTNDQPNRRNDNGNEIVEDNVSDGSSNGNAAYSCNTSDYPQSSEVEYSLGFRRHFFLVRMDRNRSLLFSDRDMATFYYNLWFDYYECGDLMQSDGVVNPPDALLREGLVDAIYVYGVRALPTGPSRMFADRRLAQISFEEIVENGGRAGMVIARRRALAESWLTAEKPLAGYDFTA